MAIGEIDVQDLIKSFIDDSKFLKDYESANRIINNEKHDYNLAKKISSRISRTVKLLLSSKESFDCFKILLKDDNIVVAASAAEYLFPAYPKCCIKILKEYSKFLSNKLDSYKVDCMVDGFLKKQEFFMDQFKKLYNTDDLDSLNREKDI